MIPFQRDGFDSGQVAADPAHFFALQRQQHRFAAFIGNPQPAEGRVVFKACRAVQLVAPGFLQIQSGRRCCRGQQGEHSE